MRFRKVGDDRLLAQAWRVSLVSATFAAPDGTTFEREVLRSPGAVAVVPLLDDGTVLLVRQFRASIAAEMWEIPAGIRDVPGEPPELTAQRELMEEAGYRAGRLELLTGFHNSAGITDSFTYVYCGRALTAVPRQAHGVEEDHMQIATLRLDEAIARVARGEITDAKTVIGLLLVARQQSGAT